MLILGIESSCDETGVALYDSQAGLLAQALHSQIALHAEYGGVVPELASRDHIRHIVPLTRQVLAQSERRLADVDCVAYTAGPGLSGALLVGSAFAEALALALDKPIIPIHHLEGHLLSPLMSADAPSFPFVALLVSGGHTQLMRVNGVGQYQKLGETLDDAAGEAFDKSAKLLGLPYPGGALLSQLAEQGHSGAITLPRPMLHSGDLNFSFSGLKTAVLTEVRRHRDERGDDRQDPQFRADLALAFEEALVEVIVKKSMRALKQCGLQQLVVAGGVGANRPLRLGLDRAARRQRARVFYPPIDLCTDNGVMIAFAGALHAQLTPPKKSTGAFAVRPRWALSA